MERKKRMTAAVKEAAITEYLKGGVTYDKVGKKYGVDLGTVRYWVLKYYELQKKCNPEFIPPKKHQRLLKPEVIQQREQEALPKETKLLQEELRKSRLHNKLLESMIEIAEQQLGIEIRKKSGTKRS
jgi:transposase